MILTNARAARHKQAAMCAGGLAARILAVTACSADGSQPLVTLQPPWSSINCLLVPGAALGVRNWQSPVSFAANFYVNQGSHPATIESVRLIDAHGLVLHRALVYEMLHARHPLYTAIAWSQAGRGALPSSWASRQPIPGAVIPTGHDAGVFTALTPRDNLYAVALDVTATSPAGGYAFGVAITYNSGGSTYTLTVYSGMAIGNWRVYFPDSCNAPFNLMKRIFEKHAHGNQVIQTGPSP
jgi:hypothetical protein